VVPGITVEVAFIVELVVDRGPVAVCEVVTNRLLESATVLSVTSLPVTGSYTMIKNTHSFHYYIFTRRHSVAKNMGCFQRHLFVCLFVNAITSEQVNI